MVSYSRLTAILFTLFEATNGFSAPRAFGKHGLTNTYKATHQKSRSTINQSTSMKVSASSNGETAAAVDPTDAAIQAAYANPEIWKCLPTYDWDKWYANDPDGKLSKVYDSPLRYGLDHGGIDLSSPKYDSGIAAFFLSPQLSPEQIAATMKPNTAEMTGDLFDKILGPAADSSKVPEPFRNALFWMQGNHFAEELVSFNRWAWRSQSEEKNGRVIAVGCTPSDWTNDPTLYGSFGANFVSFMGLQQSPCKKWYAFGSIEYDLKENKVVNAYNNYNKFYVVQEDDEFVDRFGKPVPYMTPGSLVRLSWGTPGGDEYECSPANLTLMYTPRKVATYNEETGKVEKVSPNYEALMYAVANKPPEDFTSFEYMTRQERYDMIISTVSDKQLYRSALTPPGEDFFENL